MNKNSKKEILCCPNCGSKYIHKSGHTHKGTQRYYCYTCNQKHTAIPKVLFKNESIVCPVCGSLNIGKKGYTRNGNQRYVCKDCLKRFVLKYPYLPLTKKEKEIITLYHEKFGVSIRSLAKSLKHSDRVISRFIKEQKLKQEVSER